MDGTYNILNWLSEFYLSESVESDKHIDELVSVTDVRQWTKVTEDIYKTILQVIEKNVYNIQAGYAYTLNPVKKGSSNIKKINLSILKNAPCSPYIILCKGNIRDVMFDGCLYHSALSQLLRRNVYYHQYYENGLYWRTLFITSM